ncbi:hypothetical protein PINS_up007952 [Pythium insidiosum]|nr:hypothetical protein PINS_up007952 [Pythium insidiosum]
MFDASAASSGLTHSASASAGDSQLLSPPAASVKRLDVSALSRFWWSERRLSEFRRSRQRLSSDFQHVAAKFDGQRVDGGLGIAYVVPRVGADESGVLWVQSAASDSNAQARRKKEFQDITNRHDALQTPRGSTKSTSTIFLRCCDVQRCEPTAVQHSALGVKLSLRQGHEVELVFMPGPFRGPRARDEFLDALKSEMARDQPSSTSREPLETKKTPSATVTRSPARLAQRREVLDASVARRSEASPRPTTRRSVASPLSLSVQPDVPSNGTEASTPRLSNEYRAMVRQYVRRRESRSSESIEIATKLHSATGYRIGPLSQTQPKFSADSTYRKETVGRLSKMLEKMNQDWKDVESERETRTKVRCIKDDEDVFQYTDTETKHQLSPETYRRRYLEFVGAHDVDPIIRLCPPRTTPAAPRVVETTYSTSTARTTLSADHPCFLLGVDIAGSSIIKDDFFQALRQAPGLADKHKLEEFSSSLESYFKANPSATAAAVLTTGDASHPASEGSAVQRKRHLNRRHSLVSNSLETIQELQTELAAASSTSDSIETDQASIADRAKKRRRSSGSSSVDSSSSLDSTPNRAVTGRRRRRQSLVGSISLSAFEDSDDSSASHLRRSPRLIRSAPQTPKDRDVTCPLCYDATAAAQDELARQIDAFFAATRSKVFSKTRVQAAATRNYEASRAIEQRKLQLQLRVAAEREDRERQTCTFRPTLRAPRSARLASVSPRYHRVQPKTPMQNVCARSTPTRRSRDLVAFERLTSTRKRELETRERGDSACHVASAAQISSFLERQQRFLDRRSTRIAQLKEDTQPPFHPELSAHTRALSEKLQSQSVDELLAQRRQRRLRRLEHSIGPPPPSNHATSASAKTKTSKSTTTTKEKKSSSVSNDGTKAFQQLLIELLKQEQRMKALERRRRSV